MCSASKNFLKIVFEKLFELPKNLHVAESPVVVAAGALLKDTQTDTIIAQIAEIKAMKDADGNVSMPKEGEKIETIDSHEAKMLSNFFGFANTVVREIMIPRTEIFMINVQDNYHSK